MQIPDIEGSVNLPNAQGLRMQLGRGSRIQASRRRAMQPLLEPARSVRIEGLGRLAARRIEFVGAPRIDPLDGGSRQFP